MINQIYRKDDGEGVNLEFWIAESYELNPWRDILEMAITVYGKEQMQFDFSLDESELDSLIGYLRECQRAIRDFNKNSLPKNDKIELK